MDRLHQAAEQPLHAVFLYSLEQAKATQVTDGMSDAGSRPSTERQVSLLHRQHRRRARGRRLDMSSLASRVTRSVYVVVLAKDQPSPLAPESDEEKAKTKPRHDRRRKERRDRRRRQRKTKLPRQDKDAKKDEKEDPSSSRSTSTASTSASSRCRFRRATTSTCRRARPASSSLAEGRLCDPREVTTRRHACAASTLDKTRRPRSSSTAINGFTVSVNGEKMLYQQGEQWAHRRTAEPPSPSAPPKPGEGTLKLDDHGGLRRSARRVEADVPRGLAHRARLLLRPALSRPRPRQGRRRLRALPRRHRPRDDLNYLFEEMLGEITVGHMYVGGGDSPSQERPGGLLGADYAIENGRYRFARIYNGENWNPELSAPLTQPGVNVKAGEYLLAVNGRELHAPDNLYSFFEETAGKQVVLKSAPTRRHRRARSHRRAGRERAACATWPGSRTTAARSIR